MTKRNLAKEKFNRHIILLIFYLGIIVTLTSFFIGFMTDKDKTLFGYTARIVVTGSMEPNIKANSINIIKVCDIDDINVDDVVCFNYSQDVVHRAIEKTTNDSGDIVLHTKGDANQNPDSIEINSDMIVGKVIYTFNGIASLIEKYSISPGQIDGASLARNIIANCFMIGLVIIIVFWLVSIMSVVLKAFRRKDNFNRVIDKYIKDIDELILYRELLVSLRDDNVRNNKHTRFSFIGNRLAKAKAELEVHNLHYDIKEFKSAIKHCLYVNRLGQVMDKDTKDSEVKLSDIIKYCKNFDKGDKQ